MLLCNGLLACSGADEDPGGAGAGAHAGVDGQSSGSGGSAISFPTGGASGAHSSGGGIGLPGASGGGPAEASCGFEYFAVESKPAELFLVLDRSQSMEDTPSGAEDPTSKWNLVVPAINQVIHQTNAAVSWGMKTYPEGQDDECVAGSVTNRVDVPIQAMNAAAVTAAITATTPKGNGTPTGGAMQEAVRYLQSLTSDNPKYILLATDGEPSCPKPTGTARSEAVAAVAAASAAGFPTFVVGVATTKDSATSVLNQMAVAGGRARPDAAPEAIRYYLANTQAELVGALEIITGEVASCLFAFSKVPPAPEKIAVKVSGVSAPRDPSHVNGWDYTSPESRGIELYGSWCEQVKAGTSKSLDIVFGCPNEPPPR